MVPQVKVEHQGAEIVEKQPEVKKTVIVEKESSKLTLPLKQCKKMQELQSEVC